MHNRRIMAAKPSSGGNCPVLTPYGVINRTPTGSPSYSVAIHRFPFRYCDAPRDRKVLFVAGARCRYLQLAWLYNFLDVNETRQQRGGSVSSRGVLLEFSLSALADFACSTLNRRSIVESVISATLGFCGTGWYLLTTVGVFPQ